MIHEYLPTTRNVWKLSESNRQDPTDFSRFCTVLLLNHQIPLNLFYMLKKRCLFYFHGHRTIIWFYSFILLRVIHTLKDEFWSLKVALSQGVFHIFILMCGEILSASYEMLAQWHWNLNEYNSCCTRALTKTRLFILWLSWQTKA